MKSFLLILALALVGCASSGIRYYEPVKRVDKAGHEYQRNELVASVETDMPGLQELKIGKLKATFTAQTMTAQDAVYNRAGNYVATLTNTLPSGIYPSRTVGAKGVALSRTLDSAGAAATGTITSVGASLITGGAVKAIIP